MKKNILLLSLCLPLTLSAAVDIVPNPAAPGNLGASANPFPKVFTRFISMACENFQDTITTNVPSLVVSGSSSNGWNDTYVWNNNWFPNGAWTNSNGNYITNWAVVYNMNFINWGDVETHRFVEAGSTNIYVISSLGIPFNNMSQICDVTDTNNPVVTDGSVSYDSTFTPASEHVPYFIDGKIYTNSSAAWIEVRSQVSLSFYNSGKASVALHIHGSGTNVFAAAPMSLNGSSTSYPFSTSGILSGYVSPGGTYCFTNTTPNPSGNTFGVIGAGQIIYFGTP